MLVLVRHPLPWMVSMCAHPYACRMAARDNPAPCRCEGRSTTVTPWCLSDVLKRPVSCSDNRGHNHDHLPALWADWHAAYASSADRRPRIFVRYEDLLLWPQRVLWALCSCVGALPAANLSFVEQNVSPERPKQMQSVESRLALRELLGSFSNDELRSLADQMEPWLGLFGYRIPLPAPHMTIEIAPHDS